ncbi:hypothetical protein ILYODFUR_036298, partial [Ilyodon furcidens]
MAGVKRVFHQTGEKSKVCQDDEQPSTSSISSSEIPIGIPIVTYSADDDPTSPTTMDEKQASEIQRNLYWEIGFKSGNEEGGEHSASIERYNAIFTKPTSDELDGIVFTQSDYDLTRDVFLNVGEVSVCNRLPPKKSKLRRKLVFKKDNPIPAKHEIEGEAIHAPQSPDRAPEKLTAPEEE